MANLFERITTLFNERIHFVLSVLLASSGFIILLSSVNIYAIILAVLLVITGLFFLVKELRKD